jgi:coproporphyrinogen III oxidase
VINIIRILSKYKKQCDNYFGTHIAMKHASRWVIFDYCKANEEQSMQDWFNFVEVGDSFLEAYVPIVEKRKD